MAVAAVLLAGCSSGDGARSESAQKAAPAAPAAPGSATAAGAPSTAPSTAGTPGSTGTSAAAGSSGAGVETIDPSKVVAEQTVKLPKHPESTVTIGILALEVRGPVMVLKALVTPKLDAATANQRTSVTLFSALDETLFRPTLTDVEHLKEYSPLGKYSPWVSNLTETKSTNGTPMLAWAYYAAPQDGISAIDVRITDFMPAFTRVPITR
jgi:hypothetical protein